MRDYEVVYIFRSAMANDEIEARVQKYHERLLGADGAEITAVEYWGKRELAYPIDDQRSGTYVVAQFTAPADVLTEFERVLKLDEDLLRHLVVLSEGELATPPSLRGEEDDDDDDDDDDDERPRRKRDEDEDGEDGEDEDVEDDGDEDEDDEDDGDEDDEGHRPGELPSQRPGAPRRRSPTISARGCGA